MPKLLVISKSFLEWAQSLPDVVIPAGLESDMQEAIAEAEAAEHRVQSDGAYICPECKVRVNIIHFDNCSRA